MNVELIIQRFGGFAAMARALNLKQASVPQGWRDRGNIPSKHIPKIIEAAREAGIELDLDDFFPSVSRPKGKRSSKSNQ